MATAPVLLDVYDGRDFYRGEPPFEAPSFGASWSQRAQDEQQSLGRCCSDDGIATTATPTLADDANDDANGKARTNQGNQSTCTDSGGGGGAPSGGDECEWLSMQYSFPLHELPAVLNRLHDAASAEQEEQEAEQEEEQGAGGEGSAVEKCGCTVSATTSTTRSQLSSAPPSSSSSTLLRGKVVEFKFLRRSSMSLIAPNSAPEDALPYSIFGNEEKEEEGGALPHSSHLPHDSSSSSSGKVHTPTVPTATDARKASDRKAHRKCAGTDQGKHGADLGEVVDEVGGCGGASLVCVNVFWALPRSSRGAAIWAFERAILGDRDDDEGVPEVASQSPKHPSAGGVGECGSRHSARGGVSGGGEEAKPSKDEKKAFVEEMGSSPRRSSGRPHWGKLHSRPLEFKMRPQRFGGGEAVRQQQESHPDSNLELFKAIAVVADPDGIFRQ